MNRNFGLAVSVGIGITIISIVIALYINQEPEITIIDEPREIEFDFENSEVLDVEDIEERLDEIEKNAAENIYQPPPREWQKSGPFEIDRTKYLIGEKIFIRIGELDPNEKGQIAFLRPINNTHVGVWQTIPFDGAKKAAFNYYTQPSLSEYLGICTVDDIVGEWVVVFRGTNYSNLKFEVTNEILPGEADSYIPVC